MALDDRSNRIHHEAAVHIWAQVADDIRRDITSGYFASGDKLPAEHELAAQYGVARVSVRRAVSELVSEGKLTILRGRGTYVE